MLSQIRIEAFPLTFIQIAVLAVIQGITEFLPVSSSGHLVLTPILLGWRDQGVSMDVAVHLGALGAVALYLWREVWMILYGLAKLLTGSVDEGAKLAGFVLIASLPVFLAGLILEAYITGGLRVLLLIGWAFIIGGILLYLGDRFGLKIWRITHMTVGNAFLIGVAQAFAIIPGASRAGMTITMSRFLGYERRDAARFSMLLSIPAIAGASFLHGIDVIQGGDTDFQIHLLFGAGLAFFAALLAIKVMMGWLQRQSFTPFVFYRITLGIIILWMAA